MSAAIDHGDTAAAMAAQSGQDRSGQAPSSRAADSGRLAARFETLKREGRGGLVTFVSAGDPDYATSLRLVQGLPGAGADVIEIGMPFTDPMADGPTRIGVSPQKDRAVSITKGRDSSDSQIDRSSAACTIGEVVKLTWSTPSAGGRARFSSVKKECMPPPTCTPGNAARAAR